MRQCSTCDFFLESACVRRAPELKLINEERENTHGTKGTGYITYSYKVIPIYVKINNQCGEWEEKIDGI